MVQKLYLSKNARIVLESNYVRKDEGGKPIEEPEQLFRRVVSIISLADAKYRHKKYTQNLLKQYNKEETDFWWIARTKEFCSHIKNDMHIKQTEEEFYDLLTSLDFLPNSPTLFNAGKKNPQLAGCYVLPIEDDVHSIFSAVHHAALIHQSGAGTGFNFSKIRPQNDFVKSTSSRASGPVSFMKIFDVAAEEMKSGGKRRGANAAVLRIDHPDIRQFITAKHDDILINFNLFVGITDKFMHAVEKGMKYTLINPRTAKGIGKEDANEILGLICDSVRKTGSPGLLFVDETARHNPTPNIGTTEAVSPAGEAMLLANEACPLGSINLSQMVKDNAVDWEKMGKRVKQAVHFLDNVIDMSEFPHETAAIVHSNRKIGLGVMGFADLLVQLHIKYNSDKAMKLAAEIMLFVNDQARKASIELAAERGTFPNLRKSICKDKVRNATRTAIAPTGTISVIADCSQGVEPLYGIAYRHQVLDEKLDHVNKHFIKAMKDEGVHSPELVDKIKLQGTLRGMFIPAWTKRIFVTAESIPAEWHLKIQALFQQHCDNGVAKVVIFPTDATAQDVKEAVKLAYELKCKSLMMYRFGTWQKHVLSFGTQHIIESEQKCPSCGIPLQREADVETCRQCGYGIVG